MRYSSRCNYVIGLHFSQVHFPLKDWINRIDTNFAGTKCQISVESEWNTLTAHISDFFHLPMQTLHFIYELHPEKYLWN